jgi:hypothetical protein
MPNVEVVVRNQQTQSSSSKTEFITEVGSVNELCKKEPGVGEWKGKRSWRDVTPWIVKRRITTPEEYDVVKFMVEDTVYQPDYFPIIQAKNWIGEDGVIVANLPHSPMQMLMIDWVGVPSFYIHYAKYRDRVEELYKTLDEKYKEIYKIAAESPADAIMFGDNLDGVLVNPNLFKKYFIPSYEKCAKVIHDRGKILISHFDGRLNVLKDLIAKCPQDVIEAFHPPPMGDLELQEALTLWKDKVILIGFPGSIYSLGTESVINYLFNLLKSVGPGFGLGLEVSTENLVSDKDMLILSDIMDKMSLPLTENGLEEIKSETHLKTQSVYSNL